MHSRLVSTLYSGLPSGKLLRIAAVSFFLVWSLPSVPAQDRPRLILHTQGPVSQVRAVAFSPDSTRLYAAGFDKQVHVWRIVEAPNVKARLAYLNSLRWEFSRSELGFINTLAVSPVGELIAIGGRSARDPYGDILLLNPTGGLVDEQAKLEVRVLPGRGAKGRLFGHGTIGIPHPPPDEGYKTYATQVMRLHFSPSGQRLASIDIDGQILVWDTAKETLPLQIRQSQPNPDSAPDQFFLSAIFLDEDHIAFAESDRAGKYHLMAYSLVTRRDFPLYSEGQVRALAIGENGRWASADSAGNVWLWSGVDSRQAPRRLKSSKRQPNTLAFGRKESRNLLAIGHEVSQDPQLATDGAVLELWDVEKRVLIEEARTAEKGHNYACAFSPDGRWLATQNSDHQAVYVYDLKRQGGPLLGQDNRMEVTSIGEISSRVSFADDPQKPVRIAYTRQPQAGAGFEHAEVEITAENRAQAFNLSQPELLPKLPADVRRWRSRDDNNGGWTLKPLAGRDEPTRLGVFLNNRPAPEGLITLDPDMQGYARSYCWIPGVDGKPYAVAVGTRRGFGIFVYELPTGAKPRGSELLLLRYFRDHQDDVVSLGASRDGRFLVSASFDQTVKIWSLAGLRQPSLVFERNRAWGGEFLIDRITQRLVVRNVAPMGILARRGLKEGDEITSVWALGHKKENQPKPMLDVLKSEEIPLIETYEFTASRNNRVLELPAAVFKITPGWEALLTLFVDGRGEWALWTPEGYFDSSVADGNELFGWQINRGANLTPRILKAAELQKEFDRPDIIREVLAQGSVEDAFRFLNQPLPPDLNGHVASKAQEVPELTIVEPRSSLEVPAGQAVQLVAQIDFPNAAAINAFDIRAYINGRPLAEPQRQLQGKIVTARWNAVPSETLSRFRIHVEEHNSPGVGLFRVSEVAVKANVIPKRYNLHYLAFAVKDYPGDPYKNLDYPVDDVISVEKALQQKSGDHYNVASATCVPEKDVTKTGIPRAIADICQVLANPTADDLLVVFLAGHGDEASGEYFYIPAAFPKLDREFAEAHKSAVLKENAVSAEVFLESLGRLKCRKVMLIDTCHSGNILQAFSSRDPTKTAVQQFKTHEFLVMAATSINQTAQEGGIFFPNHGAFTESVLAGLDGKADGTRPDGAEDGDVALIELIDFVRNYVSEITLREQLPTFTPLNLARDLDVPLVRTPSARQVKQPAGGGP